eukprot:scaffold4776_cov25-Tisochrysis_lutea.AAC.1
MVNSSAFPRAIGRSVTLGVPVVVVALSVGLGAVLCTETSMLGRRGCGVRWEVRLVSLLCRVLVPLSASGGLVRTRWRWRDFVRGYEATYEDCDSGYRQAHGCLSAPAGPCKICSSPVRKRHARLAARPSSPMCPLLYQLTVEFHRLRVQIQMQMYPVGLASREEGGRVAGGRGCGGSAPSCS